MIEKYTFWKYVQRCDGYYNDRSFAVVTDAKPDSTTIILNFFR